MKKCHLFVYENISSVINGWFVGDTRKTGFITSLQKDEGIEKVEENREYKIILVRELI